MSWQLPSQQMIFIAGLHRSGTSLLFQCLREHPAVSGMEGTGAPEDEGQHVQTVYRPAKCFGGPGCFGFAPEAHLTERSALVSDKNGEKLFTEWAPFWDLSRPLLMEKSPPNLVQTRFLQALFPEARFLVLTRHPVAVAFATQKWRRTSLYRLLEHWLHCHELFASDRSFLQHVHVLRYEDFVADPDGQLRAIYRWLNVDHCAPSLAIRDDVNRRYFDRWTAARGGTVSSIYLDYLISRFEDRLRPFGYSLQQLAGVDAAEPQHLPPPTDLHPLGRPLGLAYRGAGELRRAVWDGKKAISRLWRVKSGRPRQRKPAVHQGAPAGGAA